MGGKSAQIILPLVALGVAGAATGGFGSIAGAASTAKGFSLSQAISGAGLGLNVFNHVANAQSQKAAQNLQLQELETQKLHDELASEEKKVQVQKGLQQNLAKVSNSTVDGATRSSLSEALVSSASNQMGSLTAQNALSMQRNGTAMTKARMAKASADQNLFSGIMGDSLRTADELDKKR